MKRFRTPIIMGGLVLLVIMAVTIAYAKRPNSPYPYPPAGIWLQMTEDFYRALNDDTQTGGKTLTTDRSEDYLSQIAISTRYTVETNFRILQQQERIIQLLESIRSDAPKTR